MASAVYNQAALLASDVGLPGLARQWCHQHADTYLRARPLGAQAARQALEPLVNLARLHTRDGHGDQAHQLLDTLNDAVTSRTDTVIDGLLIPAATLTATDNDHWQLRKWLWTVLLADGARALTSAGRWQDAHIHLKQHKGIGRRMLDGRQVAVIALVTAGEADGALALLAETIPGDPREDAVTSCLVVLCRRRADRLVDRDIATMLERHQQLHRLTPLNVSLTVFHTRLGLTVIDAAGVVEHPIGYQVAADLIHRTKVSRDGYAAREMLAHDGCAAMLSNDQSSDLAEVLEASALGRKHIPPELSAELSAALATSKAVLLRTLTSSELTADAGTGGPPHSASTLPGTTGTWQHDVDGAARPTSWTSAVGNGQGGVGAVPASEVAVPPPTVVHQHHPAVHHPGCVGRPA
jgi:hypothetical protein